MSKTVSVTISGFGGSTIDSASGKNTSGLTYKGTVNGKTITFPDTVSYLYQIEFTAQSDITSTDATQNTDIRMSGSNITDYTITATGGTVQQNGYRLTINQNVTLFNSNVIEITYTKPSKLSKPVLGSQTTGVGYVERDIRNENNVMVTLYNNGSTRMGTISPQNSKTFRFNDTSGVTNTAKIHFEKSGYEDSDAVSFNFVPSSPTPDPKLVKPRYGSQTGSGTGYVECRIYNDNDVSVIMYWNSTNMGTISANSSKIFKFNGSSGVTTEVSIHFEASGYRDSDNTTFNFVAPSPIPGPKLDKPRLGTMTTGVGYVNRQIYNDNDVKVKLYNYTTYLGDISANSSSTFRFNGTSGTTNTAEIHFEASGYKDSDTVTFNYVPASAMPETHVLTIKYYYNSGVIHTKYVNNIEDGTSINPYTYSHRYCPDGYTVTSYDPNVIFSMTSDRTIIAQCKLSSLTLTCYYYWGDTIHETKKYDIEPNTTVNPYDAQYKKDYSSDGYVWQRQSITNPFSMTSNTSISYYYESGEELNAKKIILTSGYPLQDFTLRGSPASGSGPATLTSSPGLSSSVSGEQKITFGALDQSVRVNQFTFLSQTNFETSSINLQILINGEPKSFISIVSTGSDRNRTTTIVLASTFTIAPASTTTIQLTSGEARTFSLNVDYEGINQVTEQTIGNGYNTLTGASGTIPNSYTPTSANYCYFTCRNDVDPNSFALTINGNSVAYTCDKRTGTGVQGYTYYFEFTNTFFTTYLNINITKKSVVKTTLIATFEVQNLNDVDCTLNYTLSVEGTYNKTGEITILGQSSEVITDEIECGGELPEDNIDCSLVGYFIAPLKERSDNSTTSYILNVSQSVLKLNNVKVKRKE